MGYERQRKYLDTFHKMEPGAQKALRDIYGQAHKGGDPYGRHIIMAMRAAARYPEIFKLTLVNVVVRIALKGARLNGEEKREEQLEELLDDFHQALDAYMIPGRDLKPPPVSDKPEESLNTPGPLIEHPFALEEVRRFKQEARPAISRAQQANRKKRRQA